jgi:tRNA (adenine22-N1)-methyltransferase
MSKIKLDNRLSAVAGLVRNGKRVADIGTDHGYLVAYLVENNICPSGIAADLRKGPLENARQTVIQQGLSDKIELILSDGLQNIPENSCDDIVIAGMGGNLIAEILEKAPWVKNENIHIVAQPMTHAEVLRQWFIDNGFTIIKEKTASDGKRFYCIISAEYTGKTEKYSEGYIYTGEIRPESDTDIKYLEKIFTALTKKYNALVKANKEDTDNLKIVIDEIKSKLGGSRYDKG